MTNAQVIAELQKQPPNEKAAILVLDTRYGSCSFPFIKRATKRDKEYTHGEIEIGSLCVNIADCK
jgi:hypothetical protein